MRINVAGLLKSPVGTSRSYDVDFQLEMEKEGTCPLAGVAELRRTGKGVLVSAHGDTQVPLMCSRCLRPFPAPLAVDIQEEFLAPPYHQGGEGEDGFVIGEDQVLDLREAFRQHVLMALPLKPLCQPLCLGLCPQCGQDLNQGPCPHHPTAPGNQ